jgi:glycosyltransferase involved in cell wall biosynthesis
LLNNKTLSVIIPVYNEINTIEKVLEKIDSIVLNDYHKQVIVVDDFSSDGTREYLKELKSKRLDYSILFHNKNHGKGRAIKTCLKHAKGKYTIIQDADLEYDPSNIPMLLNNAIKNNFDVVYGSRRLNKSNNQHSSIWFFWGGLLLTLLTNILYKTKITDEATCYKLIKTDLLKSLNLISEGFEFCPEVTSKIALKGIEIHEIPINYYPRKTKDGKKIKWIDGVKAIRTLIEWRLKGFY